MKAFKSQSENFSDTKKAKKFKAILESQDKKNKNVQVDEFKSKIPYLKLVEIVYRDLPIEIGNNKKSLLYVYWKMQQLYISKEKTDRHHAFWE